MPLSSIVQVLLRLTALNWLVSGFVQFAFSLVTIRPEIGSALQLIAPAAFLLSGILCWLLAPLLSRIVTKGIESSIPLGGLSLYSLYSTAFVSLGTWFALANFAQAFNWLHYYITSSKIPSPPEFSSFYNLSQSVMTFLAGIALVATARIWARKLTRGSEQGAAANP